MNDTTPLGPGNEFDAIRDLVAKWGSAAAGIGDDAALLDIPRGEQVVASTDASIENRHFREGWLTPEEIGYRAVTAALSDLAAMAAKPIAVLWSVNLPASWRPSLGRLAAGAGDAAIAAGARIVGGNLAAASELSLTTTVIGSVFSPLRRSGAAVGDRLYVTGRLGGPSLALDALAAGQRPDPEHRSRFVRPVARCGEARWLTNHGATAGLDISDGLAGDAAHLAAASGIGLRIALDRLPRVDGATALAAALSGEEYELLVTARELDTGEFTRRFGLPLTEIGEVTASGTVVFFDGEREATVGPGHDHFRSE